MREDHNPIESRPRIDTFVAADWAEALNGKLYLMGGGFDTIGAPPTVPFAFRIAFGAILRVPWNDTNRRLPISAVAEDEQGESVGWSLEGEVEAGRPPGVPRGGDATIVLAGPVAFGFDQEPDLPFPFRLRMRFVEDERVIPLRIAPVSAGPPGRP